MAEARRDYSQAEIDGDIEMSFNDRCHFCGDGVITLSLDDVPLCGDCASAGDILEKLEKYHERSKALMAQLDAGTGKEKLSSPLLIRLSQNDRAQLDRVAKKFGMPLNKVVMVLISHSLKNLAVTDCF